MATNEIHDGMHWQLRVTAQRKQLRLAIERLHNNQWLTAQEWFEAAPTPRERRELISESALRHGWIVPATRWPRTRKDGSQVIQNLTAYDWEQIVRDATDYRALQLAAAGDADRAWRLAILAARDIGGERVSDLAAAAGRGKHAIYRMRVDDIELDEVKLLEAAREGSGHDEK